MRLTINGRERNVAPAPLESLADTLRDRLQLSGTKVPCERGECGACTVLLDDTPVYACLTLTSRCQDRRITTIEGVAPVGELHPVQAAFIAHDAVQCGFCTPGQVLSAIALLRRDPNPSDTAISTAMSGNLCRCGTYPKISAAIRSLASGETTR
ncbi:MAG: (2Fe-2S)-binding protein [Gemmatimonadaceae bacterium]